MTPLLSRLCIYDRLMLDSKIKEGVCFLLLEVKNIGKISHAHIELNGITVIAGVNNTGKSTVGKVPFCLTNSFLKFQMKF